jgi:hypothetical protein
MGNNLNHGNKRSLALPHQLKSYNAANFKGPPEKLNYRNVLKSDDICIYIIIWLSLYVLSMSMHFPTPPKPAGLDPPIFRMRKSLGIMFFFDFWRKKIGIFWGDFFP